MKLNARDRKILIFLIPVGLVLAYWFVILAPKRQEATTVQTSLTQARGERDTAAQKVAQLTTAKRSFAGDYETVIRLGKSIPASLDMPSLLVQLDSAARGTGITFTNIASGQSNGPPRTAGSGTKAAAGAPPQTGSGSAPAPGAAPTAGAPAGAPVGAGTSSAAAGLDSLPLTFQFTGSFFRLADFFHHMKRFVQVTNNQINVSGRLIVIDSFTFDSGQTFPTITAKVNATVYLSPKAQGITAGATPAGPRPTSVSTSGGSPAAPTAAPAAATVTR